MKNKKKNLLMLSILLASQFSVGITALATTETKDSITIVEEKLENEIKEEVKTIADISSTEEVDITEVVEDSKIIGPKTATETRNEKTLTYTTSKIYFPLGSEKLGHSGTKPGLEPHFKKSTTVKKNGVTLKDDEYKVEFLTDPNTDMIQKDVQYDMMFYLIGNNSSDKSRIDYADYSVNYGKSIVFESNAKERSAGAYTFHYTDRGTNFTASNALGSKTEMINPEYLNEDYYSLEVFRPKHGSLVINEDTQKVTSVTAKGNETRSQVLSRWAEGNNVWEGDVIRAWSVDPAKNNFYVSSGNNTTVNNYANQDGYAFYRATKNGLEPILTTPLELIEREITTRTTKEQLDADIEKSFVNLPEGVEVVKFIEYPDTTKPGKSKKGKILVTETSDLTGNKKIETIYDAYFNVIEVPLEVEMNVPNIPVGTKIETIDVYDFIDTVYYDGEELNRNEYTAKFVKEPYTHFVTSEDKVEIEIILNEDKEITMVEETYANIIWGDTIVSRDGTASNDEFVTSISLLEEKSKPVLKMNGGNKRNDSWLQSQTTVGIYRNSAKQEDTLFKQESSKESKKYDDVIKEWQPQFDQLDLKYGDVLHQNSRRYTHNSVGKATYVSRNEKLVRETEGYNDAYYEITKDGYQLLQLNQIRDDNKSLKLALKTGDGQETINNQMMSKIDFKGKDKNKFRFESNQIDTTTPGKRKGNIEIYEKLNTGGEFMLSFPVEYEVEQGMSVKLKEKTIPVGTPLVEVNPQDYIESVSDGVKELDPKEYTVTISNDINTMKVSTQETKVTVIANGNTVTEKTKTHMVWGDTIGSSKDGTDKSPIDVSVSMLHSEENPTLVANEGNGLAGDASSYSYINIYRGTTDKSNEVFYSRHYYPKGQASQTMELWNNGGTWFSGNTVLPGFKDIEFQYGDVVVYEAKDEENPGIKTWASREGKLIKETEGYKQGYYEMTRNGFRLMQINQLVVNSKMPVVSMNTSLEEMNKHAKEAMVIPDHVENSKDYRFEYASVDTKTSGVKTTKMNVYQKLSSGGEFMTTYDVKYQVNPQLIETFSDEKGNEIAKRKITNFELGDKEQPKPENFISFNDEVYTYKGWLTENEKPGINEPRTTTPDKVSKETTIHYIYERANNYINMTIPTSLMFATDSSGETIISEKAEIKNNSTDVATEVTMKEFKKNSSEVELLGKNDSNPSKSKKAARLNLTMNDQVVIPSLTENTKDEAIKTLNPNENTSIGFSGNYFGDKKDDGHLNYNMLFKFNVKH